MRTFLRKPFTGALALFAVLLLPGAALFSQAPAVAGVPIPKWRLAPATPSSVPFLASNRTFAAVDLAKAGYVEEEFRLSEDSQTSTTGSPMDQSV